MDYPESYIKQVIIITLWLWIMWEPQVLNSSHPLWSLMKQNAMPKPHHRHRYRHSHRQPRLLQVTSGWLWWPHTMTWWLHTFTGDLTPSLWVDGVIYPASGGEEYRAGVEVHRKLSGGGGHRLPAGGQSGQVYGRVWVCRGVARADHPVSPAVPGPQAGGAQPGWGGAPGHIQLPLLLRLPRPQHRVLTLHGLDVMIFLGSLASASWYRVNRCCHPISQKYQH